MRREGRDGGRHNENRVAAGDGRRGRRFARRERASSAARKSRAVSRGARNPPSHSPTSQVDPPRLRATLEGSARLPSVSHRSPRGGACVRALPCASTAREQCRARPRRHARRRLRAHRHRLAHRRGRHGDRLASLALFLAGHRARARAAGAASHSRSCIRTCARQGSCARFS